MSRTEDPQEAKMIHMWRPDSGFVTSQKQDQDLGSNVIKLLSNENSDTEAVTFRLFQKVTQIVFPVLTLEGLQNLLDHLTNTFNEFCCLQSQQVDSEVGVGALRIDIYSILSL